MNDWGFLSMPLSLGPFGGLCLLFLNPNDASNLMNPKPPERGVVSRAGMAVTLQGVRKDMAERGGLSDRFWPFFSMGLESPQKVGLIGIYFGPILGGIQEGNTQLDPHQIW